MKRVTLSGIRDEGISHDPEIKKRVMLTGSDIPCLTKFAQAYFPPGRKARAHAHSDMFEVFLIESGSGLIHVEGNEYPVEKGSCISVEPGEVHEIINNGKEDLVITYFGIRAEGS
jgi:mannose-6-phosphate isomerase-like protein (cupin superfamily)